MTMFPMLDDPNPPVATPHTLTRVHTRARILRRRRRIAAAAPAVLAVGVAGAIAPRLRAESPQQVATITSSTLPPATGFGVTVTVPFDDRGEVFRLAEVPAGWELAQERTVQVPEVGQFERMMGFRRPATAGAPESFESFSIYRREEAASVVAGLTDRFLSRGGELVTTPSGREAVLVAVEGGYNLNWVVDDNIWIQVFGPETGLDYPAVLAGLEYVPPTTRCVEGDEVVVGVGACGPVDYEAP